MSVQGYWSDLQSSAFSDLPSDAIAVLPIGATEQHGPHLPLSVDSDLVSALVTRFLPLLEPDQNVLVLPRMSVSRSGEHDRHPGTLSLSTDTLLFVLRDIGASVDRAGVSRLVLLNGHGGNTSVLDAVSRELRIAHGLIVVQCSWFGFAEYGGLIDENALAVDLHAGDTETSAMLATRPDLVDMEKADNFVPAMVSWQQRNQFIGLTGEAARPGWIIDDLNIQGACGDASKATAEKGDLLLDSAARNFVLFLKEFASFDHRGGE